MSANDVLPDWLLALIGEYGAAARYTSDVLRLHRWELLIAGIKQYATKPPQPSGSEGSVPEGFVLVAVQGLSQLCDALERAHRKGYMPDAMIEAWEAFDWRDPAAPQPTTKKG